MSFAIEEKKTLALLGPNGAGRPPSPAAPGLVAPTSGSVLLDGEDVAGLWPTSWLAGTSCTPEGRSIFSTLTGGENLTLAFRQSSNGRMGETLDRAFQLFPQLSGVASSSAGPCPAASSACSRSPVCSPTRRAC